jgi:hypothetical protein
MLTHYWHKAFNKKGCFNAAIQIPVHSPCWCFHQQDNYNQISSRPQPLLVFSPTRLIPPNKFSSSALVGVFTNKTIGRRLFSVALAPFPAPRSICPCWCFHQQEKYHQTSSRPQPLLVFSPTRKIPPNKFSSTALVGVFTNKTITTK